jgi:hypothetical protein
VAFGDGCLAGLTGEALCSALQVMATEDWVSRALCTPSPILLSTTSSSLFGPCHSLADLLAHE